jgi:hypothetical protein
VGVTRGGGATIGGLLCTVLTGVEWFEWGRRRREKGNRVVTNFPLSSSATSIDR